MLGRPLQGRERQRLVAEVFASYGRYWAESLRASWLEKQDLRKGVTTSGFEHVKNAVAEGRGLIIATPHLGSWEWGAACLVGSGFPLTVAVEPLEPPELFEWFAGFRRRLGMHVVRAGPGAGAAILRSLKGGSVVCLLSDRLVGDTSGVDVTFFGAKARLPAGPVVLALRSGVPRSQARACSASTAAATTWSSALAWNSYAPAGCGQTSSSGPRRWRLK